MILSTDLVPSDRTQSVHKHKYYYNHLHNFITISCPVWHTHNQYTNTNIITTIYTILSLYLVLSDPPPTHTHAHARTYARARAHTHTRSVHKHKYYYYNLHHIFYVIHSNFHNIFQVFIWNELPHCVHVNHIILRF